MTLATLQYAILWVFMMLIGGAFYEQRIIIKKRGEKYKTLAFVGQVLIVIAMLGFIHGLLYIFDLSILQKAPH